MKIFQSLQDIATADTGCVLVIGNFDAVHRGHQQILQQAKSIAQEKGKPLGLLTFEPHPRRLFRPDDPPFRLTPFDLKCERLQASNVDIVFSLDFDWPFASQTPEAFIDNVLKQSIQPSHIVVGYDFCFGQLRKGTPQTLIETGYEVSIINKIEDSEGEVLSSSRIRNLLRQGNITKANDILGWEWEIRGIVTHGDKRGRELGYPTANVPLGETVHPAYGIYAAYVRVEGEDIWRPSATNIGIRPMFEAKEGLVEAYIFDFDEDIYDKQLRIKPVQRLRGEAKFDSLEALIVQIEQDCEQAKALLKA
jgi:riboflavin kinase/FMN adenylyltransferase